MVRSDHGDNVAKLLVLNSRGGLADTAIAVKVSASVYPYLAPLRSQLEGILRRGGRNKWGWPASLFEDSINGTSSA